jgi:hypothetical protein
LWNSIQEYGYWELWAQYKEVAVFVKPSIVGRCDDEEYDGAREEVVE